ncbi:MAG: glycine cleavage system protein T, partial [Syntrophales bacterium LBB04]|nr:glycine cleavage system protein T [Syntrophales bacterium LBB04]
TRKFGGLFDVSHMGRIRIRGINVIPFLQHVLSNNAEALEPWQAQSTLIPNEHGGVIDDAYLYRFGEDDYLLVVNASNHDKDWKHLQEQAMKFEGLLLEDHTEALAMIAFQGPLTGRVLEGMVEGGDLPEPFKNRLSEVSLLGTRVLAGRTGYTGEPVGFEFFVPSDKASEIWSNLYEASEPLGALAVGLGARDTLRLEAGMPLYGQEFGLDPEGKEFPAFAFPLASVAVSFSERKGRYIGRDALASQFAEVQKILSGTYETTAILPRRIRSLALLDRGVTRHGDEIFMGEKKVGLVTSGTVTPYWVFEGERADMRITDREGRRAIALACLDAELLPEEEVEVLVRGRRLRARIVRWHGRSDAPPWFHPITVEWQRPASQVLLGRSMEKAVSVLTRSLENHGWRQEHCVNLIPSEMTPSPLVRLLQVADPVGRYAEHKELLAAFEQEVFYYQGTDFIAWVEELLAAEMRDYLGCPLVEVRPVSGQMANMTVFSAFVDFKNRVDRRREPERIRLVVNNHIGKGGHLSAQPMGALRDFVAKDTVREQYAVVNLPVLRENPYKIDLEEAARLLDRIDPEIIVFGKSMVLHTEPVAEIRDLVKGKKIQPVLMYDMAHVLGLIGPHFQDPFSEGAHIVTGSTHKTFFGTQRGIIGADLEENRPEFDLWKAIRRRAFPGMVSNHHLGTLLGLLMAALEMNAFKGEYQPQVIANAKAFARSLKELGLDVEGDPAVDFTETHQVVVNVGYARGIEVALNLEKNNIIVNYQAIPRDEGFTASSGLRMGVSEMTRFGMKEKDFQALAHLFAAVVKGDRNVQKEVARFRGDFLEMQYCFGGETIEPFKKRLLKTF